MRPYKNLSPRQCCRGLDLILVLRLTPNCHVIPESDDAEKSYWFTNSFKDPINEVREIKHYNLNFSWTILNNTCEALSSWSQIFPVLFVSWFFLFIFFVLRCSRGFLKTLSRQVQKKNGMTISMTSILSTWYLLQLCIEEWHYQLTFKEDLKEADPQYFWLHMS